MAGTLVGALAALVASIAIAAHVGAPASPARSGGSFGAAVPVQIAHVGRIEVDLGAAGSSGLRSVPCAAGSHPATSCFVRSTGR